MLIDSGDTYAERVGNLLIRLLAVVVHVDDTPRLCSEPLVDVLLHHRYQFIIGFAKPWFLDICSGECELRTRLLLSASLCNDIEAAITDASKEERPLRLFTQHDAAVPKTGEDILHGIFCLVFVAQQDMGGPVHPVVLGTEKSLSYIQPNMKNHYPKWLIFLQKYEKMMEEGQDAGEKMM